MKNRKSIVKTLCIFGSILLLSALQAVAAPAKKPAAKQTLKPLKAVLSEVSGMDVMCSPNGIALMDDGSLLVSDTYHKRLWKVFEGTSLVYAGGDTSTVMYGEPVGGYNDAGRYDSYFKSPMAVTKFLDGWAVSDPDNHVVRIVREQNVETLNGQTTENLPVSKMGVVYNRPTGLATDAEGNLYISDTGTGFVFKLSTDGIVTTVAAGLVEPMGMRWKNGTLYVAEAGLNRIVKLEGGQIIPIAGTGEPGIKDGTANQATFESPLDLEVGDDGTIYVADTLNSSIRRIKNNRVDTLVIQNNTKQEFGLTSPNGLLLLGNRMYVCDSFSRKLFMLDWN